MADWEKSTRHIAQRNLRRVCENCRKRIVKGEVFYKHRTFVKSDEVILAYEFVECAKCNYKANSRLRRFLAFKAKCQHPTEFIETEYSYIPGECVQEPNYRFCRLCGKIGI